MINPQAINTSFKKSSFKNSSPIKEVIKAPITTQSGRLASEVLKANTQRRFSHAANNYVEHANVQKQAALDLFKLIPVTPQTKDKLCIDIGAGPLCNTKTLQSMFKQVIAMDLSLNMLQSSMLTAPRICADMDNLPLHENSIDVIFSNFAVQWSADFERLIQGVYKALKSGGQAFISTVVEGSLHEIKTAFAVLDLHSHINHFQSKHNINQSVEKAGFKINSTKTVVYTDQFASPIQAIRSIKAIGATAQNQTTHRPGLLTKQALQRVCNAYPLINSKAHVSYHVLLMSLEKSH
ncbi:MAG: methyltransferase domain-containing protein [Pseudoalteromonas sp.]|uniref:methyltransferase domain-containing protein n=1 Tax=unclassified Pseudoalteromonas TaxID=194690 RepID=UPI003F947289